MIHGINHITFAVSNINKSFEFYRQILGFRPLVKWHCGAYFLIGAKAPETWFCLNEESLEGIHAGYTHTAFSIDESQLSQAHERLKRAGVRFFKENNSPGASLYFLDPDGHKLELHAGCWRSRLAAKKKNTGSWKAIEWFI